MEIVRVFEIKDKVIAREIPDENQRINIQKLFHAILGENESGDNKLSVLYEIPTEKRPLHFLALYNEDIFKENDVDKIERELFQISEKLLEEELLEENEEGERLRNKTLTQGLLFIKHTNKKLILLKLEETNIINTMDYSPMSGLSTDKSYYKICLMKKNDLNNIIIIDRNKEIAKYWVNGFLKLSRKRDDRVNTEDLIKAIESREILQESIRGNDDLSKNIKEKMEQFIFNHSNFDLPIFYASLDIPEIVGKSLEEVLNKEFVERIDSDFHIDPTVIGKFYDKNIKISPEITIKVSKLKNEILRDNFTFDGEFIRLRVSQQEKENIKLIVGADQNEK